MSNHIHGMPCGGTNITINTGNPSCGVPVGCNYPPVVHTPDSCQFSSPEKPKPKTFLGKVKDFAKGFGGAFMGLFSLKGLAVAAGCTVLGMLCPPLVPLMIMGTVGLSGFGMVKALKNGDYHAAGQNAFGLASGIFGARGFAKGGIKTESANGGGFISETIANLKGRDWKGLANLWAGEAKTGFKDGANGIQNIGKTLTTAEYRAELKGNQWGYNWAKFQNNKLSSAWQTFKGVFLGANDTPVTSIQTVVNSTPSAT
jgi:hypothetical protein